MWFSLIFHCKHRKHQQTFRNHLDKACKWTMLNEKIWANARTGQSNRAATDGNIQSRAEQDSRAATASSSNGKLEENTTMCLATLTVMESVCKWEVSRAIQLPQHRSHAVWRESKMRILRGPSFNRNDVLRTATKASLHPISLHPLLQQCHLKPPIELQTAHPATLL